LAQRLTSPTMSTLRLCRFSTLRKSVPADTARCARTHSVHVIGRLGSWPAAVPPRCRTLLTAAACPCQLQFLSAERLLRVRLYRVWLLLIKPRRWSSGIAKASDLLARRSRCPGRRKTSDEMGDLIRRTSRANPLWARLAFHGELPKPGIEVSPTTVGRRLPRPPEDPSPARRSFLRTA
jgi:hypothetical protein